VVVGPEIVLVMALFLVVPRNAGATPPLDQRVMTHFEAKDRLRLDLGVWVVSATETTIDVGKRLDLLGDPPVSAIVFGLSGTYTGRAPSSVWEWLKIAAERSGDD
jgi:hypothetical protein